MPLGQLTTEFELVDLFEWEGGYQAIFDIIVPAGVGADGVRNWAIGAAYLGDGDYTQTWTVGIDATVDIVELETPDGYSGAYLFDTIDEDFQLVFEAGDRIRIAAKVDGASYSAGDFEIFFGDFDATFGDLQDFVSIIAAPTTVYESSFTQQVTLEHADLGWPVGNWNIFFDVPDDLVNATVGSVWGASVTQNEAGDLLFSALSGAGSLNPGETQDFGFTMDYERADPFVVADSGVTFSEWPPVQGQGSGTTSSGTADLGLNIADADFNKWLTYVGSDYWRVTLTLESANPTDDVTNVATDWYVEIDMPDGVNYSGFGIGSPYNDYFNLVIQADGDVHLIPTQEDMSAVINGNDIEIDFSTASGGPIPSLGGFSIVYEPAEEGSGNTGDSGGEEAVLADPSTALSVDNINFKSWGNGLGANFEITNDADLPVDGWSVVIDIPDGVDIDPMQVWGVNAEMLDNGDMRLTAADYRSYIDAGETIRAGFTAGYHGSEQMSELTADDFAFDPLDLPEADAAEVLEARFYRGEEWRDGLIQRVAVENNGTEDVDGWRVVIDIPDNVDVTLTSVWGTAKGTVNGEGDLVFTSKVGSSVVEAGRDSRFGFTLDYEYTDGFDLDFTSSDFVFVPDDYAFA